eukprot:scaffold6570_cov79-Amphora_coffeaeformis.AAC.1
MPKTGKTDREWDETLKHFARSGKDKLKTGRQPGNGKWLEKYRAIQHCPAHKAGRQQTSLNAFFAGDLDGKAKTTTHCDCGHHEAHLKKKAPPPQNTGPTKIVPGHSLESFSREKPSMPPRPRDRYSKGSKLPADPECKYGVEYLRTNPIKWIQKEGHLALLLFGPTSGHCPHCTSTKIYAHGATKGKYVYGKDFPYWCVGVNIHCKDCNKMVKSLDGRYVATLPRADRMRMPFLQIGASHGVDYFL